MATPQIPDDKCEHCGAPIIDLFAEWTDDYQTAEAFDGYNWAEGETHRHGRDNPPAQEPPKP